MQWDKVRDFLNPKKVDTLVNLIGTLLQALAALAAAIYAIVSFFAAQGCTVIERYDARGNLVEKTTAVVHYPPDSQTVQGSDANGLHIVLGIPPLALQFSAGGVSNFTAPVDSDLEIGAGVETDSEQGGVIVKANRLIRAGQYERSPSDQ